MGDFTGLKDRDVGIGRVHVRWADGEYRFEELESVIQAMMDYLNIAFVTQSQCKAVKLAGEKK